MFDDSSKRFQNAISGLSFNNGWLYGWYCLDHVGYEINPRKRDMGYHNIHDKYLEFLDKYNSSFDDIQWHFHAMSTYREA